MLENDDDTDDDAVITVDDTLADVLGACADERSIDADRDRVTTTETWNEYGQSSSRGTKPPSGGSLPWESAEAATAWFTNGVLDVRIRSSEA